MDEFDKGFADELAILPAKEPGPRRIYGFDLTVKSGHQHQVCRESPHAIALSGSTLDFGLEFVVQLRQRLLRGALLVDIQGGDDRASDITLGIANGRSDQA